MRNFRSLVLGLVLVSLSPLGWGEDVYYCVEEHDVDLAPTDSGDAYELKRYKTKPFTFKYEADANRLAIKGEGWAGDELYYLDVEYYSGTEPIMLHAKGEYSHFLMKGGRFNYSVTGFIIANTTTGTCTKF